MRHRIIDETLVKPNLGIIYLMFVQLLSREFNVLYPLGLGLYGSSRNATRITRVQWECDPYGMVQ